MLDDSELFTDSGRGFQRSIFVNPLLEKISSQSSVADQTRSIDESLIRELKDNDIMRISASAELGGLGESVVSIANELRAIAPRCTSTAWCMWNHLCTFHHFAGLFGPKNKDFLNKSLSLCSTTVLLLAENKLFIVLTILFGLKIYDKA